MGKPEDWDILPPVERKRIAYEFLNTWRGQYIISQALYVAIRQLKTVEPPRQETSNIEDMEMLQETIFPIYAEVKIASRARRIW